MTDIVDRLETTTRSFERALFIGVGAAADLLTPACGVGRIVFADLAEARLPRTGARLVADEERSPFAAGSFDLIVSLLTLHDANDVVGALAQHRAALKPDGLFLAALFGEETMREAKIALMRAESETGAGAGARIPPFATLQALGAALQRAGFAMPVVDVDSVEIRYRDPRRLHRDLKGMGEAGALAAPARALSPAAARRAFEIFAEEGGVLRADIAYLTGWAPHPDQPKPLRPGSARRSLESAVKESRSG